MRQLDQIHNAPIPTIKSVRQDEWRGITSADAGKILPLAYLPVLREDAVQRGQYEFTFEMNETLKTLMNAINVTLYAHFIPFTAFDRFNGGLDAFNRAYTKTPEPTTSAVIPFFTTHAFDRAAPIYKTLGIHEKQGNLVNASLVEAYNVLVNYRYRARSAKLPQRSLLDTSLAAAFWRNPINGQIVPDFDQAMIDGEVPLQLSGSNLIVKGYAVKDTPETGSTYTMVGHNNGSVPVAQVRNLAVREPDSGGFPLYVEQKGSKAVLSLANIELAKQTAAFAKLRERYSGIEDDHLIDLLMDGITIPDEQLKRPILLSKESTVFGYSERLATDGDNLDKSLTTGLTRLVSTIRLPKVNTGGIILFTAEIVPEALFERFQDNFLATSDPTKLPQFLRDYLDPQKVDIVKNKEIDVLHATPEGIFGYVPLNAKWKRSAAHVGGKFYRPAVDTWLEDRQRLWSVETLNPQLNRDFYLVNELPKGIFADTGTDSFEITSKGLATIVGNTVFGRTLEEDEGNYELVAGKVDHTIINP